MSKLTMTMARARHCVAMAHDPKDSYNRLVLIIGGVYTTQHRDLFYKTTT